MGLCGILSGVVLILFIHEYQKTRLLRETAIFEKETTGRVEREDTSESAEREALSIRNEAPGPVTIIQNSEIEVLLSGDVSLQSHITELYEADGIDGILSKELNQIMKQADITMVNQEFVFSSRGTAQEKEYTFRAEPHMVQIFQDMGIDIVSLANNHSLDFGKEALEDTFQILSDADIRYVGAGKNLERAKQIEIFEVEGKKIGFLAASRVIPYGSWNAGNTSTGLFTTYSPEALIQEIKSNRDRCDSIIVYVHWGVEKNEFPEEYQKTLARQFIDAGADAVIGSHPHVMQGIEFYHDKPIVYSLGNYIFTTRVKEGALLKLVISQDNQIRIQLIPFHSSAFPIQQMEKEQTREFYRYMEKISFGITIDEEGNVVYNNEEH